MSNTAVTHQQNCKTARDLLEVLIRQCESGQWYGRVGIELVVEKGNITCIREKVDRTIK